MNYVPDSVYTICGTECSVCTNVAWSPVLNAPVHDTLRGKVFCPFGKDGTMNQPTNGDQLFLNSVQNYPKTTWGRAPQLDPRPLSKIGLSWNTS
jgi:hypothetical protein